MLPALIKSDLACIDDIGAERDPWQNGVNALCQVLTRRDNKWTIVTTNVPSKGDANIKGWVEKWDKRVADRLLRNSVIVDLSGAPSYAEWQAEQF